MKKIGAIFLITTLTPTLNSTLFNIAEKSITNQNQIDLNTLISIRDLGLIDANNNKIPNKIQLLEAIKIKNPETKNLTIKDFIFKNSATNTSVTIIGIGDYKGEVTLTYQVKADLILRLEAAINSLKLNYFTTDDTTLKVLNDIKSNLSYNDRQYVNLWDSPKYLKIGDNIITLTIVDEKFNLTIKDVSEGKNARIVRIEKEISNMTFPSQTTDNTYQDILNLIKEKLTNSDRQYVSLVDWPTTHLSIGNNIITLNIIDEKFNVLIKNVTEGRNTRIARIKAEISNMNFPGLTTDNTTSTVLNNIKNNLSYNDRQYVSLWDSWKYLTAGYNKIALSIDGTYYSIEVYAENMPPFTEKVNYDFIHIYPYSSSAANSSPINLINWNTKASSYSDFVRKYSKVELQGGFTVGTGEPTVDDDFVWKKWQDYGNISFNINEEKTISWEENSAYTKLTFSITTNGENVVLNWKGNFKETLYPSALWITIKNIKFYN